MHVNKYILSVIIVLFYFSPLVKAEEFVVDRPKVRLDAPDFSVRDFHKNHSLSEYKGSIVLLNFWSTECKPCIDEMESLDTLSRRFYDLGLRVIAISADPKDKLKLFAEKHDYHFKILHDKDAKIRQMYEVMGLPTSYIIARDGKFLGRVIGSRNWRHEQIIHFFSQNLKDVL